MLHPSIQHIPISTGKAEIGFPAG